LKVIEQVSERYDRTAESEEQGADDRQVRGVLPTAAKAISADSGDKKVQDEDRAYGWKKRQNQKKEVRGIKGTRLEVCQQRKSHGRVAIPKRQVSGSIAVKQAIPHWIEVSTQIAEKGHRLAEDEVLAKPKDQKNCQYKADSVHRGANWSFVTTHGTGTTMKQLAIRYQLRNRLGEAI
jgi:hypothetical protein